MGDGMHRLSATPGRTYSESLKKQHMLINVGQEMMSMSAADDCK
jgi:hypothetical protein